MKTVAIAIAVFAVLATSGCANPATSSMDEPAASSASSQPVAAGDIHTLQDAVAWINSLNSSTPDLAQEMSAGIVAIEDAVVAADLPAMVNNEVNQALISLNSDVLANPDNAAKLLDELKAIGATIAAATQ